MYSILRKQIVILLGMLCWIAVAGQEEGKKYDALIGQLERASGNVQKVDLMNDLADNLRYNQVEEGLRYAGKALELSRKISYKKGAAKSLYNMGVLYYYQGDYKSALKYYEQSKLVYNQLKNTAESANVESAVGSIYFSLGQYAKALEFYNAALNQYEAGGNLIGMAQLKDNIATLHFYQKDYKKSLRYNLESITTFQKANYTNNVFYSTALTNLGFYYFDRGDYKNAERYYLQSLVINRNIGNQYLLAKNHCSLGDIYIELNHLKKAEEFHRISLQIGQKIGNQEVAGYGFGDLGKIFLLKGRNEKRKDLKLQSFKTAAEFLEKSTALFKKTKNIQAYQEYSKVLSDTYIALGLYKKALEFFQQHTYYKDSLFNEEKVKAFAREEIGFEFIKREDSIKMVNEKKIAVKDATLQENRKNKWLYFFGIFLLLVIGALLIFQNRNQKKNNLALSLLNQDLKKANEVKNKFFNILNHDLRAPVSNVIKLLKLTQNREFKMDDATKHRLESQTVEVAEHLLLTMEDLLFWSKGQMQHFKLDLNKLDLKDFFTDMMQQYQPEGAGSVIINIPEGLFLFTDENYLKTIVRNLTSNAMKATANTVNPRIEWTAESMPDALLLTISDNGEGADATRFEALYTQKNEVSVSSGLGLHLVREMSQAIQCSIKVQSDTGNGTHITLIFSHRENEITEMR